MNRLTTALSIGSTRPAAQPERPLADSHGVDGPTIGVVVPAYNAARYLAQTLTSVRDQRRRDLLCCVVNDGSTDETATIAARFSALDPRFRTVSQPNRGQTSACNRGLAELTDEVGYICFLDADDILHPDALSTLLAAAERDPATVGAHGLASRIDASGNPLPALRFDQVGATRYETAGRGTRVRAAELPTTFENLAITHTLVPPAVALLRTSALARTNGFDPDLAWWNDWDMFLRLARLGDFGFVDQVVVDYRLHGTNMSGARNFDAAARAVRVRAFESPDNTAAQQQSCRRAWRTVERWHARGHRRAAVSAIKGGHWRLAATEVAKSAVARTRQLAGRPTRLLRDKTDRRPESLSPQARSGRQNLGVRGVGDRP